MSSPTSALQSVARRLPRRGPDAEAWRRGTATTAPMVVVIVLVEALLGPAAGAVAVFGALVSMWNPGGSLRQRLRRFAAVGPLFPASMALGAATGSAPLLAIAVQAVVILLVTTCYHRVMRGPGPGPLHLFYACSIGAYLGGIGQGWSGVAVTAGATAATAALTLLGLLPERFPALRALLHARPERPASSAAEPLAVPPSSPADAPPGTDTSSLPSPLTVGLRCAAAGLLAGLLAELLGLPHSYWAVLSATIVLHGGLDSPATVRRARHRVTGTVGGVLLVGLLELAEPAAAVQLALVALAVWGMNVVMAWHYAAAATFITIMTLQANLLIAGDGGAAGMLGERLVATGLGVGTALLVLALRRVRRPR